MISVQEAKSILKNTCPIGACELQDLNLAVDSITAKPIKASIETPAFDNAAMDGYGIAWSSDDNYQVVSTIQAGSKKINNIASGQACRIFTGAKIPQGVDTIIPQELIKRKEDRIYFDKQRIQKGANIRLKGSQNRAGDTLIDQGVLITPGIMGLLASVGIDKVPVYRKPSIGIILTGNEIKTVGTELEEGEIYDANGPILKGFLRQLGINTVETVNLKDDEKLTSQTLVRFLASHDIIIVSGGISVGEYDFVKQGMDQAGVEELFYKVSQRPGKPFYAGANSGKLVFGLPGNPCAVFTCFSQYIKPSILQWMGHSDCWEPSGFLPLENTFSGKNGFTHFLKAKKSQNGVSILSGQESFNLIAYGKANVTVEIPAEHTIKAVGDRVAYYNC
ncbi:molybdopterin molybdotransferase MoeA [Belliella sp. DSM 111904]|uniref:Molybdopterin molybdenumtransferase n=1 Tax=Belliella filtrata TaxID=2923435 RepID=A0ABS9UZA9_9BACT|nr:molybdopterin molybdotransferase MoeA [Belliella filtrata]MCH7409506.1 molybdopterin molybdotransferase MoeA [Belliella filtrata]